MQRFKNKEAQAYFEFIVSTPMILQVLNYSKTCLMAHAPTYLIHDTRSFRVLWRQQVASRYYRRSTRLTALGAWCRSTGAPLPR